MFYTNKAGGDYAELLRWRLFFFTNEGNEPVPIHAEKGEMECKFWIKVDEFEIEKSIGYHMNPNFRKEIRKIIYEHFDYIVEEWNQYFMK
ncbi:MAG: DUF4160 domain-containing protein [Saprospiraceae bacterium]|nr:DUF4160 domain-containing protein [Saprospiraceae bacterium]